MHTTNLLCPVSIGRVSVARTQLYSFQRQTVRAVEAFEGRAALVLDPGLGKTICTLSFLARNPHALPAVVVCPAAVKYVWEHEAITHAGRRVVVCEGQSPPERNMLPGGADIYVVNYDILKYWVNFLRQVNPQTIIYDECQALINRGSKRTKAARKLAAEAPHVLALSGTPLMNRPAELWPTLNIVRPDLYPSFWGFAQEFCKPTKRPWGWEYKGATNLDVLHRSLLTNLMIRHRKADVLQGLPAKMREVVPCPLKGEAEEEYRKASLDFLTWLRQQDTTKFVSAKKAAAMTQIGYLLRLVAKLKFRQVAEWANAFLEDSDEKLVLFAYHKKMIQALQRRVAGKAVVIDGSVTGRARAAAVAQFQKDASTRVAICQLHAAGVGITLTAASTVAFTEVWWRPSDHLQAADRCHRIGQDQTVWEHWLVAPNTIEEKLCRVLEEKQGVLSAVMDGGEQTSDLDVFSRLMQVVQTEGMS